MKDGKTISFWFDNWSDLGSLIDLVGDSRPRLMGIPALNTVSEAFCSRDWQIPSRYRNRLIRIVHDRLRDTQPLTTGTGPDNYFWGQPTQASSEFSTKKTWEFLRPFKTTKGWLKAVWFKHGIPKHSFIFWTDNLDRLPVKM